MTKDESIAKNAKEKGIPIFTLVAKDACSRRALACYLDACLLAKCDPAHIQGIRDRMTEFRVWQDYHPDQVKNSD
jgi:hypothetical protein